MKNICTFLCSLFLLTVSTAAVAQCTPDSTAPNAVGLYPAELPDDTLAQPYSQVLTFVFPKDTIFKFSIFTFPLKVCEVKIDTVIGIPDGMSYQLDQPGNSFKSDFTDPTPYQRGCVLFSGTPTTPAPNNQITVKINIILADSLTSTGACHLFDPGFDISAYTKRTYTVPFTLIDTATNGVEADLLRSFSLAPNPAQITGEAAFHLAHSAEMQATILDLTGRTVWQSAADRMAAGPHTLALDYRNLASGAYTVVLTADGRQVAARKLMLMH
jgi:hypothetical protein